MYGAQTPGPARLSRTHLPLLSRGRNLTHQEIYRENAGSSFPRKLKGTGRTRRHREEIERRRSVDAAKYAPRGGLKMRGMSELLYLRALQPRGEEDERRGKKKEGEGRLGGEESARRSHLEDLEFKETRGHKAIKLGSPDSKVYRRLLITNRSLCISQICWQSHPLLKPPDSSCCV